MFEQGMFPPDGVPSPPLYSSSEKPWVTRWEDKKKKKEKKQEK
jgi:hypothetical protein